MNEHPASISALPVIPAPPTSLPGLTGGMNARPSTHQFQSSGLSSSPVRAHSGALAPDPVEPPAPRFTGTAGAVPPPAPAPNSGTSCIRTEDGTVILFDRASGRAVSGLTRAAAEARLRELEGAARPA
jgi:hypothetical protein